MPLDPRRTDATLRPPPPRTWPVVPPGLPGLAEQAAAQGWQPVTGAPFGHDLVDGIHDITRARYGDSRLGASEPRAVGDTTFSDALRARIDGRTVIARTPEEAMGRFGSLPESQRMQLLAMFMRVDGSD